MTFNSNGKSTPLPWANDDIADKLSSTSLSTKLNQKKEATPHHPYDTISYSVEDTPSSETTSFFLSPDTALHSANSIQRRLSTGTSPHGDGTASDTLVKSIDQAIYVTPVDLIQMLRQQQRPLLIDVRYQPDYDSSRIRDSIHVNMPSLLLKRYRRGTVSNFSLESFITTPQGIDQYTQWLKKGSTSNTVVVYDDTMDTTDKTTSAWTLVGALSAFFSGDMEEGKIKAKVVWLQGGFMAFEHKDTAMEYLERPLQQPEKQPTIDNDAERPNDLSSFWNNSNATVNNGLCIPKVVPALSRSATTFSSAPHLVTNSNMQRRSSLFTLDTTNVRNKHRSPPPPQPPATTSTTIKSQRRRKQERNTIPSDNPPVTQSSDATLPKPPQQVSNDHLTNIPRTKLADEYEEDGLESEPTPMTENEYAFIVSAIVPGFLYLGPEISTVEQMQGLSDRSIQRILNMAEECDDDVPGLKQTFKYSKLAARDTVEMQHVEPTLRKAVKIIEEAKKHHEAIYVHCKAGKSRSVAVILAYFILSEHWTLGRAYKHVIKARPWVSPNIGFVAELIKLEESVLGRASSFAGTDWHKIDLTSPPSPASQKEIGMVQHAWSG